MEKPEMKRIVGISTEVASQHYLTFYANETIALCAREFGRVRPYDDIEGKWTMDVDERLEFADVVAWLESFNA